MSEEIKKSKLPEVETRTTILSKIARVYENVSGIDVEDITEDSILGLAPSDFEGDDTRYMGVDEVEMTFSLLYLEEAFNTSLDDIHFVKRSNDHCGEMWKYRTVGDMITFVETSLEPRK
ncbi:MAG: hypothetical protein KAH32_05735 [Chlamydiia bacterium]|nr:hypothetical protein [Chlamydiia bacterium]